MIELRKTAEFERWLLKLRDLQAEAQIDVRIDRLAKGHAGDSKAVGEGVYEMRIHCGPGYRIYYTQRGSQLIIVLAGGNKGSQEKDIWLAQRLARDL